MAACRRFSHITTKSRLNIFRLQNSYSTHSEVKPDSSKTQDIVIPYRIHRGPTDILKALASTVSKDYTAAQYKYEDDPYFIPSSSITKRAFALSKESGKKAARYFLEQYPDLFKCNKSVPHIKAFDPPPVYTEDNVTSCESLIECITSFAVDNAVIVYDILKKKDIPINQAIKQDLLELLCFYNGKQPPDEDYYEDRYFSRIDERQIEKWNAKGMAEKVFEEMDKDNAAYSAMIAGAAKFQDCERALFLLDEMRNKNLTPTLEAYNSLMSAIPRPISIGESRWECILNLLGNMEKDGLKPDLYTMNACLQMISLSKTWKKTKSICLHLLAEMKRLNIEPSLGTYTHILNIFFVDANYAEVDVLYEIVNKIEGKEFEAVHPFDVSFFMTAMAMCARYTADKDIAYRLNNVLEFKRNSKLLGNALSESTYFKNFFKLLIDHEDVDKFMEVYERYIPNIYIPEPTLMYSIIQNIHFSGLYQYLPKLCSDILMFEHTERENILSIALEAAGIMKHEQKIQEELMFIISKIVEKLNIRLQTNRFNFRWTGPMMGNILKTFINGEDFKKTCEIMKQLVDDEQKISGYPEKDVLLSFCEFALQNHAYDKVKPCITYAVNGAYPEFRVDFKKYVEQLFEKEKLQDVHRIHVDKILRTLNIDEDSVDNVDAESRDSSSSDSSSSDSSSSDSSSSDSSSSDSSSSDEETEK